MTIFFYHGAIFSFADVSMTLILRLRISRKSATAKFSKLGKLLSLRDGSRFLSSLGLYTTNRKCVYVIHFNRWAYGILLWEILTIGA